jgi:hypothetical protein
LLRFFWVDRGQRQAGDALLDAAEDHLRARGVRQATACASAFAYPFYLLPAAGLAGTQVGLYPVTRIT